MTKIEKVVWQVSDLFDFYMKIRKLRNIKGEEKNLNKAVQSSSIKRHNTALHTGS